MTATLYKINAASCDDILAHLREVDAQFSPPLSTRINLDEYARKLSKYATSFEAWDGSKLVGMINMYMNDEARKIGYITNVSVLRSHGNNGIATSLLTLGLRMLTDMCFDKCRLEVSSNNHAALSLYRKVGFQVINNMQGMLLLQYDHERASCEGKS